MAQALFTQFLTGFSIVAILLIISLGLAVIFGVMRVINMAHGDFIMAGAYVAFVMQEYFQLNLFWGIPASFLVLAVIGMVVEWGLIRRLYGRPLETLLATWGVSIVLQQGIRLLFGPELRYVKAPHVRAVNQNRPMAEVLGIDTRRVDRFVFAFGSGLAGVAGTILAPIKTVSPTMGFPYAVDSYMVIVLGGVGRLVGTVAGASIIGESETVLAFLYNNVIAKLLVFTLIVLVIRVFPQGLFTMQRR